MAPSLIRTETHALAMTLGAEGKKASYANALSMAARFRLDDVRAKEIIAEISAVALTWRTHFREVGVSDDEISRLESSFRLKA